MGQEDQGTEKAIVLAFLRKGHPGLAFATVLVKSAIRTSRSVAVVATCLFVGPYGGGEALVAAVRALAH